MGAEVAISTVVQLLGKLLTEKVSFIRGVSSDVGLLREELNMMQAFLTDANRRQARDERIRNWLSEVREVALDAEDAIEMFTLNTENQRNIQGRLERCVCFHRHMSCLDRIGEDIASILARLKGISLARSTYGIQNLGESDPRSTVEMRRRLAPREKDEDLIGVEDDVKKLLTHIMEEDKKGLSTVAVVGMGGIGKSALAREVYNHPRVVSGRFDYQAWVVVSREFTPLETIKQLIVETIRSEQQKQDLREEIKKLEESTNAQNLERKLTELLCRRLEGKTYFIVLDDVWEKEDLDRLMTIFPNEHDKPSRLLITTRNDIIGKQCQSSHEMKALDSQKSWELFLKKGLTGESNEVFPEELEPLGREIVAKCEGLPLAITTMGGLLAKARSSMEWKESLDELKSNLGTFENNISRILELSYYSLSPKAKSCFLCLAFFKEDGTIPVKRLINIMVEEGYIEHTGETTEEIGRGYLGELINRNIVQVKDLTLDNRVKTCHLPASLRTICAEKAKEEIDLEILKGDCSVSLMNKPRRRVVHCNDLRSFAMKHNKHIRSLYLLNMKQDYGKIKSISWKRFQKLKILELDLDVSYNLQSLPHSFRFLLGLKQLRIRVPTYKLSPSLFEIFDDEPSSSRVKLPTWLNTLKRLEVLDMEDLDVEFPDVALEMDSMRHIHASVIHASMITDHWKNIETLKYIRHKDWMKGSLRLIEGCQVQELGILLDDDSSRVRSSLEKLENLVKLCLVWSYRLPIGAAIIPRLEKLTKLKLRGWMSKCPSASMLPPNLLHLTLEESYLHEDPMEELSRLPKLLSLKLKSYPYYGETMQVPRNGFPELRALSLRGLDRLRSVHVEEGAMPQLNVLLVDLCPALDTKNLSNKSYQLRVLRSTK